MLSKAVIKEIKALELKKNRDNQNLFVAEGRKLVSYLLPFFTCERLITHQKWAVPQDDIHLKELIYADAGEIRKVSFLKTPQDVVAVFRKPHHSLAEANPASQLILTLDGLQNPGNLGTIIRIAEWFGIEHIVCSMDTADAFNPKTVQATMGALAQVKIHYTALDQYLINNKGFPIYGTFLSGENIYQANLTSHGIILLGNEGNGIRPEIESCINKKLHIPVYPSDHQTMGSLNVSTAAAIICGEFRRRYSGDFFAQK